MLFVIVVFVAVVVIVIVIGGAARALQSPWLVGSVLVFAAGGVCTLSGGVTCFCTVLGLPLGTEGQWWGC